MSIELVMPPNHLILCHPLLLPPSVFPSIKVFSKESVLQFRWPKYWSFSINPSHEYSGLISLGLTGWIFLLSKGLKSLLQHHSSKASVLQCSAFFMVKHFPHSSVGKQSACNAGDLGSIPELGRSPGEGSRLPTPVFCLGKFHGLLVHGVTKRGHN